MAKVIKLDAGESMREYKARVRRLQDAGLIANDVEAHHGTSARKSADRCGLSLPRWHAIVRMLQSGELSGYRLEYGTLTKKGVTKTGWYSMRFAAHHGLLPQSDRKDAKHEIGVRRRRFTRIFQVEGYTQQTATAVLQELEDQLGVSIEAMTKDDAEAFEHIVYDKIAELNGT